MITIIKPTAQLYVEHDTTKRKPQPKLCKDCKYFKADTSFPEVLKFGKCIKVIKINLVDGSHVAPYAETVRQFDCKGRWWKSKDDNSDSDGWFASLWCKK